MTSSNKFSPLMAIARIPLANEAATEHFGRTLGGCLTPGLHIQLHGDLGAGKTTVVRAALRALGHTGTVKSPTYALVESYVLPFHEGMHRIEFKQFLKIYLYHFDFYRFNRSEDWQDAGFRELFGPNAICLVEWPEQAGSLLPAPDLSVQLEYVGSDADAGRNLEVQAFTESGVQCLKCVASQLRWSLMPPA
jgi:tRNA threonylcarbamoyladenosine biosynthesis protein TsaE